jgi:phosphohistidine phosphatase
MQLLIVRHGIAAEQEDWAPRPDEERPLTERGELRMRDAARGLRQLVSEVRAVLTSPLKRALQTADIVAPVYGLSPRTVPELAAGCDPHDILPVLESLPGRDTVALVGHEPDLSTLVGLLLSGESRSIVSLGKGGACLLQLGEHVEPGRATLLWLLTPSQLRSAGTTH